LALTYAPYDSGQGLFAHRRNEDVDFAFKADQSAFELPVPNTDTLTN